MAKPPKNAGEIAKLERLRSLLLDNFTTLAESNELTPTDRRTLATLLKDNGMLLDPSALPQSLRDQLPASMRPDADLHEDAPQV